ncbi:PREDICTED: angiotensin-converting enzyme-like [Priapulus caudatus]|uniref:Angiotensin-converting enzyme-like n=1 Tax=Priapulus caudatus TaxID=37621 RepID=A0ABM1F269_PRICU|nr:PREDICTED: angiotensin-converting enzyme-like [Priapulus caudatus]
MGSSRPWPEVMEMLTGDKMMDAGALIEYFNPLIEWLDTQINENAIKTGWDCAQTSTPPTEPPTIITTSKPDSGHMAVLSVSALLLVIAHALQRIL